MYRAMVVVERISFLSSIWNTSLYHPLEKTNMLLLYVNTHAPKYKHVHTGKFFSGLSFNLISIIFCRFHTCCVTIFSTVWDLLILFPSQGKKNNRFQSDSLYVCARVLIDFRSCCVKFNWHQSLWTTSKSNCTVYDENKSVQWSRFAFEETLHLNPFWWFVHK